MNPYDPAAAFAAHVRSHPECLDPAEFELLERENPTPGYALQPWPIFLAPEVSRRMREVSEGLTAIARTLPTRLFDGDAERIAETFGLAGGGAMAELLLCEPNGIATAVYRGDYIQTAEGLKCIELNAGSGVTAWNLSPLGRLYPRVPVLARFLSEHGLRLHCPDTLWGLLRHFLARARENPDLELGGEIVIAIPSSIIDDDIHNPAAEEDARRCLAAIIAEEGVNLASDLFFCDYADLRVQGGRIFSRGKRVHVLFEQQIADAPQRRQAIGSFKMGRVDLYTGPASQILMDKRNLALMSEQMSSPRFSAEEQRLLAQAVPWTRCLKPEAVERDGERVWLPELLGQGRERWVLKKAYSHSGRHVVLGRAVGAAEWEQQVAAAIEDGGWIVQEALESIGYELLDEGRGAVPHDVVWGLFVFDGQFQGGSVRALPKARGAVINILQGARTLPYFEVIVGDPARQGAQ